MAFDERPSDRIASIVGRALNDISSVTKDELSSALASLLSLVDDRVPPLILRQLDELTRVYVPGVGAGPFKTGHYQVALAEALRVAKLGKADPILTALMLADQYRRTPTLAEVLMENPLGAPPPNDGNAMRPNALLDLGNAMAAPGAHGTYR